MPSNPLLHFITQLVNFEGFKVTNYHFITDNEVLIELENQTKQATCPSCQKKTRHVHQSHRYRVRDIPLSSFEVFLLVNRRQFRCKKCEQVFSEELNFVKKRRTYTKRLAQKVVREVLETNVVNAGQRNRMSPSEIETILKELEADLLKEKPKDLKKLGIDEITHLKGGKNYAAVLVDKERATKLEGITHSKYPLLKKKESLNETEKEKLKQVEKVIPELIKMYQIKETFRDIFESRITADEAFWHLVEWTESAYQYFPQSCQTIKRWIDEILAYFDNRTTQGIVEGINQKIKLIKRRAYGLSNFHNFRRRVLLNWHFC
jgi:transposase